MKFFACNQLIVKRTNIYQNMRIFLQESLWKICQMYILPEIQQQFRFYRKYGGVLCISIEKLSYKRPLVSFYIPWAYEIL
jgi:hypothetical protein